MTEVDPKAVLDDARQLAAEGRYDEALEKHIWFHKNALTYEESLAGVRLSFALADWEELGAKYPPALQALVRMRDDEEQRLQHGELDEHLFYDVVSINENWPNPWSSRHWPHER